MPKKTARKPRAPKPTTVLVIASKIREHLATRGMRTSADVIEATSKVVEHHLDRAVARANAAGRQTVKGTDL